MNAATFIYLANLCDGFSVLFTTLIIISVVVLIICTIVIICQINVGVENTIEKTAHNFTLKITKNCLYVFSISFFFGIFIPSERTIYLMMGANYLQKSNIPNKVEKIIDKKLDFYLQELTIDGKKKQENQ